MGRRRPPLTSRVVRGLLDVIIHAEVQCNDQEEDAMYDKAETADMRRAIEYLDDLRRWHSQKRKGGE